MPSTGRIIGIGAWAIGPGRSSAVSTACTPGTARAFVASIERMRACACGLRTKQASSVPASLTSSTKRPRPVSRAGSSSLLTRAPNCLAPIRVASPAAVLSTREAESQGAEDRRAVAPPCRFARASELPGREEGPAFLRRLRRCLAGLARRDDLHDFGGGCAGLLGLLNLGGTWIIGGGGRIVAHRHGRVLRRGGRGCGSEPA